MALTSYITENLLLSVKSSTTRREWWILKCSSFFFLQSRDATVIVAKNNKHYYNISSNFSGMLFMELKYNRITSQYTMDFITPDKP